MLLIILISVAVIVFFAGNTVRIVHFLRMPTPLRWELYPIPKGPRARQRYGGSYFEQSDWWTKSHDTGRAGELAFMAKEILLLANDLAGHLEDGLGSLIEALDQPIG